MPAANEPSPIFVLEFMCWGVGCRATFESEAKAMRWLRIIYDKGWLFPDSLYGPDGNIMYNQDQLMELISE